MQLVPRYLLKNQITVTVNEAGFTTEYSPVYSRQIKLYRGIKNTLQFKMLNADQKPVDISNYTPKFLAYDENKTLIVDRLATVTDDGSTTTRGTCIVEVSDSDLLNVQDQFITYSIFLYDEVNGSTITYSDTGFGNTGIAEISSEAFPGVQPTTELVSFFENNEEWVSNSISAQPGINGNSALHTAVFYTDGFIGDIIVEATLDNTLSAATGWSALQTITCTGAETEPMPINYYGVFNHTRFRVTANPAEKITKVLVRN
jgi:hypothetical protein